MSTGLNLERNEMGRFVFNVEIPTPKKMTSNRMALSIWYEYISRNESVLSKMNELASNDDPEIGKYRVELLTKEFQIETEKLPDMLTTSRSLQDEVKTSLKNIIGETCIWVGYLRDIFQRQFIPHRINCIDPKWWQWLSDGTLDYQKTTTKMLISGKLTEVQKFVVRARHCLADEILAETPVHALDFIDIEVENEDPDRDRVLNFWIWRVKSKTDLALRKTMLRNFTDRPIQAAYSFAWYHFSAFEYLWDRLKELDREVAISMWIHCCDCKQSWNVIERLFSSMLRTQQLGVLSKSTVGVTCKFVIYSQSTESALWPWKHVKATIDQEKFLDLINTIFDKTAASEERTRLLIEIWDTARNSCRNYAAKEMAENILCMSCQIDHHPAFLEFSFKVFRQLTRDIDRAEFIKSLLNSNGIRSMFLVSVTGGNFKNFYTCLEWHFPDDPQGAREFTKSLLETLHEDNMQFMIILSVVTKFDMWKIFSKFIDETFIGDEPSGLEEKQSWIWMLMEERYSGVIEDLITKNGRDIIQVIETVFSNQRLICLKQSFYNSLLKHTRCDANSNEEYAMFVDWLADKSGN